MFQIKKQSPRKRISPIQKELIEVLRDIGVELPVTALADHSKVQINIPLPWGAETPLTLCYWKEKNIWVSYQDEISPLVMSEGKCYDFVTETVDKFFGITISYLDLVSRQMGAIPENVGIFIIKKK